MGVEEVEEVMEEEVLEDELEEDVVVENHGKTKEKDLMSFVVLNLIYNVKMANGQDYSKVQPVKISSLKMSVKIQFFSPPIKNWRIHVLELMQKPLPLVAMFVVLRLRIPINQIGGNNVGPFLPLMLGMELI